MKISMALFFYLFTFVINLWQGNSSQQTSQQCLSTINMVFSDEDKILIQSVYFKGTHQRFWQRNLLRKAEHGGVNKLLKKLRDTGTVDRWPGSGRPRSACTEENVEAVTDLVSSHEDKPQTHRTVRGISQETGIHRCTQNQFVLIFFHLCWISAENWNF